MRDVTLFDYSSMYRIKPNLQFICNFVVVNASKGSPFLQIFNHISTFLTAEEEPKRSTPTKMTGNPESFTTTGSWTQNPAKSTMWLGTEDGWSVNYNLPYLIYVEKAFHSMSLEEYPG
jgi:hypothetical protein